MVLVPGSKNEYFEERDKLIGMDRALRRDSSYIQSRSVLEKEADEILRRIRAEEAESIWKEDHLDVPHPFPGMEFLTGKKVIEKTRIFKIISQMPKGALLHVHMPAVVEPRTLLDLALKERSMYVCVPIRLTPTNLSSTLPIFLPLPVDSRPSIGASITSSDYIPNTWVHIAKARETFDRALGGPKGFDDWVVGALTINASEAYKSHNTVTKIWKKFKSTFSVAVGLSSASSVLHEYFRAFFVASINDGISYVELRIDPVFAKGILGEDGKRYLTQREVVLMFGESIREVKQELKKEGCEDKFLGARLIYCSVKKVAPKDLYVAFEDSILTWPMPGYDLVGQEDALRPIIDYLEPLLYFRKRQAEEQVEIPFLFHAGETLGDGTAVEDNIYDAILLGTKRIGHGFSLVKHPKLLQICRERKILLEVCPISNEVLRLTSSMPMHPLPCILNNGVPVALSCDDPSVFGNLGVTYDFYQVINCDRVARFPPLDADESQVLVASEINGLSTLGTLARDSIEFSMMPLEEKTEALRIWEVKWNVFLQQIVNLYGLLAAKHSDG
ncbi:hypothetical protein AGABI2DRAFT_114933 [Agaricus bisporus var. bisporus H97]|uniref:hypothetical protein n=1 Tax=Agaricus bisporus var. bisporus (strain H97 / ATCC MYA-4626 / FGSC 10389) TaxID=936046 RepID=UPI00029F635D|nr:hypothetical protein AGABI2DRAFT_114933 [Agaricus bisporus var. bisporus H97]EKV49864.1 hypothetical protein AGABI2DRAFT_114933 [Agaricus bisporus var. bisporus H97]